MKAIDFKVKGRLPIADDLGALKEVVDTLALVISRLRDMGFQGDFTTKIVDARIKTPELSPPPADPESVAEEGTLGHGKSLLDAMGLKGAFLYKHHPVEEAGED